MNELYVWRMWNLIDRHLRRQTRRGKAYDHHLSVIANRELHFTLAFQESQLYA